MGHTHKRHLHKGPQDPGFPEKKHKGVHAWGESWCIQGHGMSDPGLCIHRVGSHPSQEDRPTRTGPAQSSPLCLQRLQDQDPRVCHQYASWNSLEERRRQSRLTMMFKIQHQLVDINPALYCRKNDARTRG